MVCIFNPFLPSNLSLVDVATEVLVTTRVKTLLLKIRLVTSVDKIFIDDKSVVFSKSKPIPFNELFIKFY